MKAIIGTEDDILGFGLTGIEQKLCINKKTTQKEIQTYIDNLDEKTTLCLINETALQKINVEDTDTAFVKIPDHEKSPDIQRIKRVAKETLGINI